MQDVKRMKASEDRSLGALLSCKDPYMSNVPKLDRHQLGLASRNLPTTWLRCRSKNSMCEWRLRCGCLPNRYCAAIGRMAMRGRAHQHRLWKQLYSGNAAADATANKLQTDCDRKWAKMRWAPGPFHDGRGVFLGNSDVDNP